MRLRMFVIYIYNLCMEIYIYTYGYVKLVFSIFRVIIVVEVIYKVGCLKKKGEKKYFRM